MVLGQLLLHVISPYYFLLFKIFLLFVVSDGSPNWKFLLQSCSKGSPGNPNLQLLSDFKLKRHSALFSLPLWLNSKGVGDNWVLFLFVMVSLFLWDSHLHLSVKYTDSKRARNAIISCPVCPELLNSWRSAETESEDWCVGKQFKFFTGKYSQCHYLLFIRMKISPLCLLKKVVRKIALSLFLKFVWIMWQRGKSFFCPLSFPFLFFFPQSKPK